MNTILSRERKAQVEVEMYLDQLHLDGLLAREKDAKLDRIFERLQEIRLDVETWENAQTLADNAIHAGIKLLEKLEHAASLGFTNLDVYELYTDTLEYLEDVRYRRDSIRPDDRIKNHSIQMPKTSRVLPLNVQALWKTCVKQPDTLKTFTKTLPNGKRCYLKITKPPFYLAEAEKLPIDDSIPSLGKLRLLDCDYVPCNEPLMPVMPVIEQDTRKLKFLPK